MTNGEYYRANESRSAHFSHNYLISRGVNPLKAIEISRLIQETAHGRVPLGDDKLTRIVHDIDMSILAAPPPEYRVYRHSVSNELSPLVSGLDFDNIRRDKFIVPTLEKGKIYATLYGQEYFEEPARINLQAELEGKISFVPEDI